MQKKSEKFFEGRSSRFRKVFFKQRAGRFKAQNFAGIVIDPRFNPRDVLNGYLPEVRSFRKEAPDHFVCVLVRAAFVCAVRMAIINRRALPLAPAED